MPQTDENPSPTIATAVDRPAGSNGDEAGDAAASDVEGPPRRPRQSFPRIVWCIVGLHVVVLGAYSILIPTYRSPDEPLHVDLAHLWSTDFTYPAWDERDTGSDIIASLDIAPFNQGAAHLEAADAPPKDERPSFEELEDPDGPRGRNHMPQHPPLYYVAVGTAERAVEVVTGDPDFQQETWFYRLVGIAFTASLPLIIWRTTTTLRAPQAVGVAAMLVPLAIPQYLHIAASANNDTLQIVLIWALTPVVLRLARGELGIRTVALAGLLTGLGLLTKAFAFMMLAWVACALALALVRAGRAGLASIAKAGALYGVVALATGGWWWIRNLVVYGALVKSRYNEIVRPGPGPGDDIGKFLDNWATLTVRRFWGDFGYYDTHLPSIAITVATVMAVAAILVACVGRDRIAGTKAGDRVLLLLPLLLLMALQFQQTLRGYLSSGRMAAMQGRYWFGALAAVSVLIALGVAKVLRRRTRWLPLVLIPAIALMQAAALATILGYYWGPPHSALTARVRAIVAWAPFPGELIAAAAVVGAVIVGLTAVELGRFIRQEARSPALTQVS